MSKKITVVGTEKPASVDWFKELIKREQHHRHKNHSKNNFHIGANCDANIRCTNKDLSYCGYCNLTLCKQHWG